MLKIFAATACLWSGTTFAMNGLRPIGVSAESNALGGTGVTNFYNYYDALYKNPAEMAFSSMRQGQSQAVFGMTYGSFKPQVKATYGKDQDYKRPVNNTSAVFPSSLGLGTKISEKVATAIGVYGGGGGADYGEKADSLYRAKSKTQDFTAAGGVSYAIARSTAIGINVSASRVDTHASNLSVTSGKMTDTGGTADIFGALVGVSQQFGNLTFGAIYQPDQTAKIHAARDIENTGVKNDLLFTAVPTEAAAGVTWREYTWMIEADYRFLQWSQAQFLKSVGWKDQHVLAVGYEYGTRNRLRLGVNASTDAVSSHSNTDGFSTTSVSGKQMINLAGDAFATTSGLGANNLHYTIGSSSTLGADNALKVNTAFVYMQPGGIERDGYYNVPTGEKRYGWRSKFGGSTLQLDLTYLW